MSEWRLWQQKILGFVSAWWLLALPLLCTRFFSMDHAAWSLLPFVLPCATLLALIVLLASESERVQCVAAWFLVGVLSMVLVGVATFFVAAVSAPLGGR